MDEIQTAAQALKALTGIELNLGLAVFISGVLNGVGAFLKKADWFPTRYIPYVIIAAGTVAYPSFEESFKPSAWVVGVGCGLCAIGAHQGFMTFIRTVTGGYPPPTEKQIIAEEKKIAETATQPPQP